MEDIWPQLREWMKAGERFALATVVNASKPSPRDKGAVLAVHEDGERFIGSVSAGCVEHEVMEAAQACLRDMQPRWLRFGPGEGYPWEIELSCGGRIEVRVDPGPHLGSRGAEVGSALAACLDAHEHCLLLSGPGLHALWSADRSVVGDEGSFPPAAREAARARLENPGTVEELEIEGRRYLFRTLGRRRRLFVVGASHIGLQLTAVAKVLQYEVVVVDPREAYAQARRFASPPDALHAAWPGELLASVGLSDEDALVALSHDPKIDDQALAAALDSPCGYIGALGSKRSHEARRKRLGRMGYAPEALDRIHGPVGIDIGSRTPAEIAISIAAQLVQVRRCQEVES